MISNDERRFVLGGSECAIAAGLHPKVTREELLARKLGLVDEPEQNWLMWAGKGLEGFILDTLEHRPQFLVPPQDWTPVRVLGELPTQRHADFPWAVATVDGLLELEDGRRILLELKTSPAKKIHGWGDAGTSDVPVHYACQVLWNTMVALSTGRLVDEAWLVVMFGTREPQVFPVPYDAGKARWLLERGQEFMSELETRRKAAA